MKKISISLIGFILILSSCKIEHEPDFEHKLVTLDKGIHSGNVYIISKDKAAGINTFKYGQTVIVHFAKLSGFQLENGDMFPELDIKVLNTSGETIMYQEKLLGGLGQPEDAVMYGELIMANPVISAQKYKAIFRLYDSKSDNELVTEMDFELLRDEQIQVSQNGLRAKEVYLFDSGKNAILYGSKVPAGSHISLDFQLLDGYQKRNGNINLGMETTLIDAKGTVLTENKDAFPDFDMKTLSDEEVIKATLSLTKGRFNSPLTWTVRLWDKNSSAEMTAAATLDIKNQ